VAQTLTDAARKAINIGPLTIYDAIKEEKTRNGNWRTLSRHGELAGARAKRPELIWPARIAGRPHLYILVE
jgi:hypothetical protein